MESLPFKVCTKCGHKWQTKEQFVLDPHVHVFGYNAMFEQPEEGVFLLTHDSEDCMHSFSIKVGELSSMYRGKRYRDLKFLGDDCESRCFKVNDLGPCRAECCMRWPRDILQCLREHKLPDLFRDTVKASAPGA